MGLQMRVQRAAGRTGRTRQQGARCAGRTGQQGSRAHRAAGQQVAWGAQGCRARRAAGQQGARGAQGCRARGAHRAVGQQGARGAAGLQGARGAQGSRAHRAAGQQGAQGSRTAGQQGARGAAGLQGVRGAQGSRARRAAGHAGRTGQQGARGCRAARRAGRTGQQGAQGCRSPPPRGMEEKCGGLGGAGAADPLLPPPEPPSSPPFPTQGEGGGRGGLVLQIPSPPLLHPQQGEVGEGGGGGGWCCRSPPPHCCSTILHPPGVEEKGGAGGAGAADPLLPPPEPPSSPPFPTQASAVPYCRQRHDADYVCCSLCRMLACFVALLAPPEKYVTAQSSFLVEKAKTLLAVANQTAANLTAAQADAARRADEVAAATQALSDLLALDTALNDRVSSISDMNISLANAQNDLSIANKILAQRTADLNAYNDDPTKFPQIPAAQKAVTEATRRVNITSTLIQKWQSTVQDAVQAEAEAEKTFMNHPSSTAAQVAFTEARETRKYVEDVYGDIVAQDLRAQARLTRVQQELTDLPLNPPTVDVNVFPKAVEDAKVAVFVARQVYDGMLAAITDAQKAVILYKATKAKAVTDAKTHLAKAKQSQAVADKKLIQLTDKLKAALMQADRAEKAAGISNTAGVSNTAGISKTAAKKKKGAIRKTA
ncbi:unnamed protein product [Closterium sp. Naga37s-1]|nr:unnamed protein product [Closterium sp. Naga37s-1]